MDQQYHQGPNFLPSVSSVVPNVSSTVNLTLFLVAKGCSTWTLHISYTILCKRRDKAGFYSFSQEQRKKKRNQPSSSQYVNKYLLTFHWLGITGPFLNFPFNRAVESIDRWRPGLPEPITKAWGMDLLWSCYTVVHPLLKLGVRSVPLPSNFMTAEQWWRHGMDTGLGIISITIIHWYNNHTSRNFS